LETKISFSNIYVATASNQIVNPKILNMIITEQLPEFDKHNNRVKSIMAKSKGDNAKAIQLAEAMCTKITNEVKALHRGKVAEHNGFHEIAEVFYRKAHSLGSMSKGDYMKYKMEYMFKLLEENE